LKLDEFRNAAQQIDQYTRTSQMILHNLLYNIYTDYSILNVNIVIKTANIRFNPAIHPVIYFKD
jgi:hypothetical protein